MARGGGYLSMAPLCKGSWQPVGLTEGLTVVGSRQSLRHRLWRRHLPLHKGGQRVEKVRHASQKCQHFFEEMQPAACTLFPAPGRENSAEGVLMMQENISFLHAHEVF